MDDEKLVQLVKEHDVIFNKKRSGYKVLEIKAKAWREVAMAIGAPVEECTKRWNTLRDRFVRECRRLDQPTGSAAGPAVMWELFESMMFLKDHTQPRKTKCSMNVLGECNNAIMSTPSFAAENDVIVIDIDENTTPSTERANRKRKAHDANAEGNQFSVAVDTFKKYVSDRGVATNDEFSSFCTMMKYKLQRLPRNLANKGMRDILNYVIALEDFNEGIATEFPSLN